MGECKISFCKSKGKMAILKRLHYTPKKYPNIAYHKIYTFNVYNFAGFVTLIFWSRKFFCKIQTTTNLLFNTTRWIQTLNSLYKTRLINEIVVFNISNLFCVAYSLLICTYTSCSNINGKVGIENHIRKIEKNKKS